MKILQVNDYDHLGGCEVLMHLTADGLRAQGHDVDLFTAGAIAGYRPGPVRYVDSRPCRRTLAERLRAFAPDVVHLHNFYHLLSPGILAELAQWRAGPGRRVVMTAHDYHLVCPNSGLQHFTGGRAVNADLERLARLPYVLAKRWDHRGPAHAFAKTLQHVWNYRLHRRRRAIDVVICPGRFMQSVLDRFDVPTVFVPNPAPPPAPAPAPITGTTKRAGPLHLLFAGRLAPEKGVAEFLGALPSDLDATFEIIGDGEQMDACRRVACERGLDGVVRFTGRLSREDTLARLEHAHVVVLPSRWYENAPVILLEALSRGATILVSDLGGMREIVDAAGVGYTFDPDDPATVAAAITRIADAHRAGTLNSFDARAFLSDRSEERYLDRVLAVYRDEAT